jgi:tetrahydromethanopterin S-methyltransferase subunit G
VQTTQPRDIGILTMVIGLFVILFVVAWLVGPPATFG